MVLKKTAIGLFCGCGGLDYGAEQAGFEIVKAFDTDLDAVSSYNTNLQSKAELLDLNQVDPDIMPKNIDLLLGGPPCQGFSTAGSKRKDDPRNKLWQTYLQILVKTKPKFFVIENVPGFLKKVYPQFLKALNSSAPNAYHCETKVLYTQFYGVPQRRHRLFVVGARKDVHQGSIWPKPEATEFGHKRRKHPCLISIQDCLENLGPAKAVINPKGQSEGLDHVFLPLEKKHFGICQHIPNGGSLKSIPDLYIPQPYKGRDRSKDAGWMWYYRKPLPDLPGRTVLASVGPTFSQIVAPDVWCIFENGKWSWDPILPAEYTDSHKLYTSPIPPRRLTIRECARLQTFPDDFTITGDVRSRYRQIGNAVPVEFAKRLCVAISNALDGKNFERQAYQRNLWD